MGLLYTKRAYGIHNFKPGIYNESTDTTKDIFILQYEHKI